MSQDYRTYTMTVILTASEDLTEIETMIYHALRTLDRADVTSVRLDFHVDECDSEAHVKEDHVYVKPWTPAHR